MVQCNNRSSPRSGNRNLREISVLRPRRRSRGPHLSSATLQGPPAGVRGHGSPPDLERHPLVRPPQHPDPADDGRTQRTELHFRMLDARNKAPVKYERVNAETGEEVPWKEIVKAFEYSKGNYVVLEPEDLGERREREPRGDRDRGLRRPRTDHAGLLRETLRARARQESREGLRAVARSAEEDRQGRHRPRGDPHQGIPVDGASAGRRACC